MGKVCIVTLNDNSNLGNRLQNYALQKYLEENNLQSDTLWIKESIKQKIICKIKFFIFWTTAFFYKKNKERLLREKRKNYISKFTDRYIKCKKVQYKDLNDIEKKYDCFIFGSDQIWHPYALEHNQLVCGDYIKNTKKISYAASLAVDSLEDKYKEKLKNSLMSFDKITVREDKGKEILKGIIHEKDVEVVIDPVMLISDKEWEKISVKPKKLESDRYILIYFLGKLSESRKKEINRIAKENNCKVINLLDKESEFYIINPNEFIYLEKNAFLICTDSFHSCVFAILFNRPFLVFDREDNNENMSSRIETLISKFELRDRIFTNKINDKNLKCDYTKANKILNQEREKSKKIIEKI